MKRKKQKGFTLVEVIVVAVIVAVLAAVAIPLYMGYIRDSRVNVCRNTAATIASAMVAKLATNNAFTAAGGQSLIIPSESDPSGTFTNINLPTGFTYTATGGVVTVTHTSSGVNATCNYQ